MIAMHMRTPVPESISAKINDCDVSNSEEECFPSVDILFS